MPQEKKTGIDQSFFEKLRLLNSSRIFIALSLLIATLIIRPGGWGQILFKAMLTITICHAAMSIFFLMLTGIIEKKNLYRFAFMPLVWDILFHTSIIYLTGGINSQYKFLYWLSIFFASILFLRTGAFVAAALSALCYAMLIDLEYFESLPKLFESFSHFTFSREKIVINSIVFNSIALFFVAYVSSLITTRLSRAEADVLDKEKKLRDLEEKVMHSRHLASIGEMAARIAHEIRNPLTSVSASMEMLSKRENEGSNESMILEIAKRESRRLNQLLTDFLDYARPSVPEFQKEYLSKLLRESVQFFQQGYPNIKSTLNVDVVQEVKLFIDPTMVSQLFWNILKNASESMEGQGEITTRLLDQKDWYVIEIEDNGTGFQQTDREKIFEPFYSSKQKGTGLGLSIAYRIMQSHHGTIELEPLQNRGVVCRVAFPLK